jgi:hypothetical protein
MRVQLDPIEDATGLQRVLVDRNCETSLAKALDSPSMRRSR